MYDIHCPECNGYFDYTEHIVADYTEIDGTILSTCPYCGEEIEVEQ
jgi:hypothetical protein